MKKIITLLMLTFIVSISFAQYTPMTAAGYQFKRILCDSTLHIPSFCGVPTLRNSSAKNGAIALDTCNNLFYKWTNATGWTVITGVGNIVGINGLNGSDSIKLGGPLIENTIIYGNQNFNLYDLKTIDLAARGNGEVYIDSVLVGIGGKFLDLQTDSTNLSSSDTSYYKPLAIGSSQVVRKMSSWPKTDTISLSNRINLKINISDTAAMLSKYLRKVDTASLSNRINLKLNIADTATMLSKYLRKVDTLSLSNRINLKLNIADTATMLSKYLRKVDTLSLSNRINLKLNISDTTNKWVNNVIKKNDSTITIFKGNSATDITLPRGTGGGTIPTLQQVTDVGNNTTNSIVLDNGNQIILDNSNYFGNTSILLYDNSNNSSSRLEATRLTLNDQNLQFASYYNTDKIQFFNPVSSMDIVPRYGFVDTFPAQSGTLAMSVNNIKADSTGNITLSTGSGTVTSITQGYGIANSPNPIVATGTITVDTATLSGKYVRITDTANMLSPYPIGSGAATTVAFWNGTRSLTNNSQIAIDNSSPTSPSLQIRASTGSTRSFMNPTYSGVQYNATNYAINNISTTTPSFINHEEIINRESRLYSNSLQFSNLSTSGFVTLSPPISFNNRNYTLPDSSGTIALNEYTVKSISRTPGKDSIIFYLGSTRYAIKDSVGTNPPTSGYYGAFSDTLSQNITSTTTAYPLNFRVTDLSNGVTVVNNNRILFANAGIYNLQYSAQFANSSTSTEVGVSVWIRKNGVDVPGSTGYIQLPKKGSGLNGETLPSWNFVLSLAAGDSIVWYWRADNTSASITTFVAATSPTRPSTASTILTVTQQSGIMAGTGITGLGTSGNAQTGATQILATGTSGTDFTISSSSNTQTFNLPIASASNTGKLSSTDWSTFNGKIGAADTSVFQRKNIAAYSLQANNTASAANVTTQTYRDVPEQAYTGTITFTGTAPTTIVNNTYQWSQIGKTVTLFVNLLYTNSNSTTNFTFDLPTDCPSPSVPTGFSGASAILYYGTYGLGNGIIVTGRSGQCTLKRNSANTGYEISAVAYSAIVAKNFQVSITYRTP